MPSRTSLVVHDDGVALGTAADLPLGERLRRDGVLAQRCAVVGAGGQARHRTRRDDVSIVGVVRGAAEAVRRIEE